MIGRDGSPFDCEKCSDRDKDLRNCFNRLGLSDNARAVTEYTGAVIEELNNPPQGLNNPLQGVKPPFVKGGSEDGQPSGRVKAQKVFSLGDIRLYECPVSFISAESVEMMRMVYLIEGSSTLLLAGGWGNQPMWLVEAFELLKAEASRNIRDRDHVR